MSFNFFDIVFHCVITVLATSSHHIMFSTVVRIMKVWGFSPKTPPAKNLLCDSIAALVRHSQAQKYLRINSKPLH